MDLDMNSIPEDAAVAEPLKSELDHETRTVRHHGRNILVAIDHGMDSRRAFDWALTHLIRMADTLYLLHIMPTNLHARTEEESALMQATEVLMDKLTKEAYEVAMVRTEQRIIEGEPGKAICAEAARLQPTAIVMGSRGRGVVKSVLLGSVSEYCMRHSPCPVVVVPHRDDRLEQLDA